MALVIVIFIILINYFNDLSITPIFNFTIKYFILIFFNNLLIVNIVVLNHFNKVYYFKIIYIFILN